MHGAHEDESQETPRIKQEGAVRRGQENCDTRIMWVAPHMTINGVGLNLSEWLGDTTQRRGHLELRVRGQRRNRRPGGAGSWETGSTGKNQTETNTKKFL